MDAIRILALFYGIDRVTVIWEFLRKIIYYDTIGFRFTRAFPMRMEIETNLIYSYFCFFKRCIAVKLYTVKDTWRVFCDSCRSHQQECQPALAVSRYRYHKKSVFMGEAPAPENHFYYVHCSRASQC